MKYCTICRRPVESDGECPCVGCEACGKLILKTKPDFPLVAEATVDDRFCGNCDMVFNGKTMVCPHCSKETSPITELHLRGQPMLLSGLGAEAIWE